MAITFVKWVQFLDPEKDPCGKLHEQHTSWAAEVDEEDIVRIKSISLCSEAEAGDYILLVTGGMCNVMKRKKFKELFPFPQKIIMPVQPTLGTVGWM